MQKNETGVILIMPSKILFILTPPVWEKLPPLGIALLSEHLSSQKIHNTVFDMNIAIFSAIDLSHRKTWTITPDYTTPKFFNDCFHKHQNIFDELAKMIRDKNITHVGFTVLKSNRQFSIGTAGWIKKVCPGIKIIFGGPEVYAMSIEGFPKLDSVDHFVVGDGEKALETIMNGSNNDRIIHFIRPDSIDFFPEYNTINLKKYPRTNALPVITSRGCINHCAFCSERLLHKNFRTRNPENVFEEIRYHYEKNGVRWFTFYDSMFNAHLNNMEILLDMIIASGMAIQWDAQIGIHRGMGQSLMRKMKASGCINLFIGLESGSDPLLRRMNKWFTAGEAADFFRELNDTGLQFEVSLIANYPGETEEEFNETLDFISRNAALIKKIAQVSRFRNYPGTSVDIPDDYDENKGESRIRRLVEAFKESGIPYTASYIDNLL